MKIYDNFKEYNTLKDFVKSHKSPEIIILPYTISEAYIEKNDSGQDRLTLGCKNRRARFDHCLFGKKLSDSFIQEIGASKIEDLVGKQILAFESFVSIPKRVNAEPVYSISGITPLHQKFY